MRTYFLVSLLYVSHTICIGQTHSFWHTKQFHVYNDQLSDTIHYETIWPKAETVGTKLANYVVFDRQNELSYGNTINAIHYLMVNGNIAPGRVIGISLPNDKRWQWTSANKENGRAEYFLNFVLTQTQANDPEVFTMFIGHSRTAIFSLYAFIKRPDRINAIYAASAWNLGDNDVPDEAEFDICLQKMAQKQHNRYLYFSSGSDAALDGHEIPCKKLAEYLRNKSLPTNLKWKYFFHENASHYSNYALFVNQALFDIFQNYRLPLLESFALFKNQDSITTINWDQIDSIYAQHSLLIGHRFYPDITFYNSIASGFSGNFGNVPETYRAKLIKETLEKGMIHYSSYDVFPAWYGEILAEEGNKSEAKQYLEKALSLVDSNPWYSDKEKMVTKNEIQEILKEL